MDKYGYYKYLTESNFKNGENVICGYNMRHTMKKFINYDGESVYQVYYKDGTIKNYKSVSAAKTAITKYDRL